MTRTIRPKLAASLVVYDQSGGKLRLLMGRRSEAHVFMPGYHVFPGGAYERQDRKGAKLLSDEDVRRITSSLPAHQSSPSLAQAIARTALRELEEETAYRLKDGHEETVLHLLGRAITPPGMVRRYDTRFFIADSAHFERGADAPDNELLDIEWMPIPTPDTARIHTITEAIITETERYLGGQYGDLRPCFRIRRNKRVVEYE